MRKAALAALLLAAAPASAGPREDVLAVVEATLRAINTGDAALIEQLALPSAIVVAQGYDKTSDTLKTRIMTIAEMSAGWRAPGRRPVDERIQTPTVHIQRDLAHVWSPYTIDIDGKRLHCGIDSFGLAKVDGAWRLTSLTWTAEPNGCAQ
ncbi:MAG: nuclear transport factor 2 family protein [Polymorphobacter sp.]|uniref:nuclear transport factor 2 family protein n=1 Tax=Polymorphobacter sp. TaxID=1909290 RepID=UPI003A89A171